MRLVLLLLSLTTTFAAEKTYTFRDFSPTRYIDGPRLTPALLKDKGTLIFFWAYELESPRGGDRLKFFQKIADDHKEDLVVIGIENLGVDGSPKNITSLLKKTGVACTIYSGCRAPFKISLYPYICAFDREGKLIYNGNPQADDLADAIAKAIAKPEKNDGKKDPKKDEKDKLKIDPKKGA
jgi:hypothetical protein